MDNEATFKRYLTFSPPRAPAKSLIWCGDIANVDPLDRGVPCALVASFQLLGAPIGNIPFSCGAVEDCIQKITEIFTYSLELMTRKRNLLYSAHPHHLNSPIVFVHATYLTSYHLARPSTASNSLLSLNYLVVKWRGTPKFKHFCWIRMAGWVCARPGESKVNRCDQDDDEKGDYAMHCKDDNGLKGGRHDRLRDNIFKEEQHASLNPKKEIPGLVPKLRISSRQHLHRELG